MLLAYIIHIFALFSVFGALILLFFLFIRNRQPGFLLLFLFLFLQGISYALGIALSSNWLFSETIQNIYFLSFSAGPNPVWAVLELLQVIAAVFGVLSLHLLLKKPFGMKRVVAGVSTIVSVLLFFSLVNLLYEHMEKLYIPSFFLVITLYYGLLYYILLQLLRLMKQIPDTIKLGLKRISFVYLFVLFPYMFIDDILMAFNISFFYNFSKAAAFISISFSVIFLSITALSKKHRAIQSDEEISAFSEASGFTKREEEIFPELLKGKTYKEIGQKLFISVDTVKTHVSRIYKKTRVSAKQELKHALREFLSR